MIEEEAKLGEAPNSLPYEIIVPGGAVIKKGRISKKKQLLALRLKPLPRMFFVSKVIRIPAYTETYEDISIPFWHRWRVRKFPERFIIRWNVFWSEALGAGEGEQPSSSQELDNLLLADDIIQMRNGVVNIAKFILDNETLRVLAIVFAISIPFGILLNTILGLIPSQVVHWIP